MNDCVDVRLASETKTGSSFPTAQLFIQGYSIPIGYAELLMVVIKEQIHPQL